MAKPNSYMDRMARMTQAYIQATCDIYSQYVADNAVIVLHDEFGFGPERIRKFLEALKTSCGDFDRALGARTKAQAIDGETDYLREIMDVKLREAMGDGFTDDFEARYPAVEKVRL